MDVCNIDKKHILPSEFVRYVTKKYKIKSEQKLKLKL